MEEVLKQMMGKKVDVGCGTSSFVRGDVTEIKDGLLYLRDEHERTAYIAIDKIAIVSEVKDALSRPGFVGN